MVSLEGRNQALVYMLICVILDIYVDRCYFGYICW